MLSVIEDYRNEFKIKLPDDLEETVISFLNSKDGGNTYTSITTETTYKFTNLTQSTSLNLKVKVEDNNGTTLPENQPVIETIKVID